MGTSRKVEMAARQAVSKVPAWKQSLARWVYNRSEFNKLGLRRDNTLYLSEEVQEAVRRLPKHLQDERQFRISRALLLSNNKAILPKDEWTQYEDDERYLRPYLEQVEREFAEKAEWNKK